VRISSAVCRIAAVATLLVAGSGASFAQSEQPAAKNFGPRKGAQAQQAEGQQQPAAETVAKHGLWEVQCAAAQDATGKAVKSCGMLQTANNPKNQNIGVTVIVSKLKQGGKSQTLMRVLAPIGVYLPTGVAVEIDGGALPNRLQFTRCTPRVCEAFGEASPDTLKRFSKGTAATFFVYDRPGNGFPMKISLEGFSAGLTSLDKL
jgi:invasion protein IalB